MSWIACLANKLSILLWRFVFIVICKVSYWQAGKSPVQVALDITILISQIHTQIYRYIYIKIYIYLYIDVCFTLVMPHKRSPTSNQTHWTLFRNSLLNFPLTMNAFLCLDAFWCRFLFLFFFPLLHCKQCVGDFRDF